MRILAFVPPDPPQRQALEEILRVHPNVRRIERAALGGSWDALENEIAGAHPKHGFALVDPPMDVDGLQRIDEICRRRLGKNRLPRAVFYAPASKKLDPDWRAAAKEAYHYFHRARRSVPYAKPTPVALKKSMRLAVKTDSLLRWGLLGPMAAAAAVLLLGLFVFRDALLRRAGIAALQAAFGAKAEIGSLGTTLAPDLRTGDLAVADARKPMRNLFEFGSMKAAIQAGPLFSGRFHAEELSLDGLRFGGERKESGALPGVDPPPPPPEPPAEAEAHDFGKALEELLKSLEPPAVDDLQTVRRARQIEKEARERTARYESLAASNPYQARLDKARASGEALRSLALPPTVDAALKDVAALRPDAAMLEKARADLAAAQGVDLAAEAKAIEAARKDVEEVKKGIEGAQATVGKAKEIKKAGLLEAPKILQLLKDLAAAQQTLSGAPAKLDGARASLEKAKADVERKQKEAEGRLAAADASIAQARKAAEGGAEAGGALAALGPKLAQARSDLEKHRKEVEAAAKASSAELDAARGEIEGFRKRLEEDVAFFRGVPASLQEALEADRRDLEQRYSLDRFNAESLVRALLGEEAAKYVRWALAAHGVIKPYLGRPKEPKPRKAPAERGIVYEFPAPAEARQPRVWIKKASFRGAVSLQGEAGTLEGAASHLSSDPALVGEEARLELRAEAGPRKLSLALRIAPSGELRGELAVEGFALKGAALRNRVVAADLKDGGAALRLAFALGGAGLRADGRVAFTGLKIEPGAGGDAKAAFVGDLLKGVDRLEAGFEAEGGERGLTAFRVSSEQAAGLSASLREAVKGRVEEARQKALAGLDAQAAGPRRQAEEAAAKFLGAAPGLGQGVTGGLSFDGLDGGAGALARLDALGPLLSGRPSGGEGGAALTKELDALEAQSSARKKQNAEGGAAQAGAAEGALSALGAQQTALAAVTGDLNAELDRLKKLK